MGRTPDDDVMVSQFTTKFNDGYSAYVPRKYDKWVVDCQCYTLEMLERELVARVNWVSNQWIVIYEFDEWWWRKEIDG